MSPAPRWLHAGDPALARSDDPADARRHLAQLLSVEGLEEGTAQRAVSEVLRHLDRHGAAAASRTTAPAHLTASAVVVDAERRRAVVLLHRKLGRWLQPGGHADGDLQLAGVALREATEETGIDGLAVLVPPLGADVHDVDHGDALGAHQHLDVRFLVAAPPGALLEGNHESTALRWVEPGEVLALSGDPHLEALVRSGLDAARAAPPVPPAPRS